MKKKRELRISPYLHVTNNKTSPIYLNLSYRNKRKRISSGITIPEDLWSNKDRKIKYNAGLLSKYNYSSSKLNAYNNDIQNLIHDIQNKFEISLNKNEHLNLDTFIKDYKKNRGAIKEDKDINIGDVFNFYFERKDLKPNTRKNYKMLFDKLKNYSYDLVTIEYIDITMINKIKIDLKKRYKLKSEECDIISPNTLERMLNNLKTVFNYAYENEYIKKDFSKTISKVKNEIRKIDRPIVTLTVDEFNKFKNTTFEDIKLESARLNILFMLCTGQRKGDYKNKLNIERNSEDGNYYWHLKQGKTKFNVSIPISETMFDFIKKSDFKIKITEDLNVKFKEIAKELKMDRVILYPDYEDDSKFHEFKLYEVISLHATRRTFVTVLYNLGVNLQTIMEMTGHKSERELKKYLKILDSKKVEAINLFV